MLIIWLALFCKNDEELAHKQRMAGARQLVSLISEIWVPFQIFNFLHLIGLINFAPPPFF